MLEKNFSRPLVLALVVVLVLSFGAATPAFAQGNQIGIGPLCAGQNITLASGQSTQGMLAFGCDVEIQQGATVNGDIADFGSNFKIDGTVNGNIVTFGGNIALGSTAVVAGNISSMGGNITSQPGATVQGGVSNNSGALAPPIPPVAPPRPFTRPGFNPFEGMFSLGFNILGGIVTAIAFAALGALVVIFAPNATRRVSNAVQAKPLNSAGVGCLTLILLPILCILLFITIIGIPVSFILGLLSAAAWVFGGIGIGLLAGEKILQAFKTRDVLPVLAVIIGIIVLMLIGQVPIIGWFVSLIVGLLGLGAVVLTRFGTRPYPMPTPLMLAPAAAAAAPSAPGAYTPSAVDVAVWEEKAKQAQARDAATLPDANLLNPVNPAEPSAANPPLDNSPPNDAGETKPNE